MIVTGVLCSLLFVLVVLLIILPTLESYLMQARRETTSELTAVGMKLVEEYYQRAQNEELTDQEARARALKRLRSMRYGPEEKDYFWVNDMDYVMLMHPYRPDLVGRDLEDYVDMDGKPLFQAFVNTARKKGSGFVDYMWQWKDDPSRIVPKVSHIRLFEPWNWILGTGLYVEDIHEHISSIKNRLATGAGVVFCLLLLMSVYMIWQTRSAERQQRAAVQAKSMLDTIVESTSDLVAIFTQDGTLKYMNKAGFQLLGFPQTTKLRELHARDLHPASIYHYLTRVALPTATRESIWTGESLLKTQTGRFIPVSQVIMAHYDALKNLTFYSTIIRDISVTRIMQDDLKQAHAELEQRVRMRTRDLETVNKQLKKEITERREIERNIRARADFERVISRISSTFINCPVDQTIKQLNHAISEIGRFFESEHCFVVFYANNSETPETSFTWTREDDRGNGAPFVAMTPGDWNTFRKLLAEKGVFKCSRVDPPSPDSVIHQHLLRTMNAAAISCVTIERSGRSIGFWGISTTAGRMVWQEDLVVLMRFLSEVFVNAIDRKNSEDARLRLEIQLQQAQKMESIGQLAAGIAHEINTPIQFIGDNVRFFSESFTQISTVIELLHADETSHPESLRNALRELDWNYMKQEVPQATEQTLEGVRRVSEIVQALKVFSHPGAKGVQTVDLNRLVASTVTVARNEWKYIAELSEQYDSSLEPVSCLRNEIGQVILNILINACHAIAEKFTGRQDRKGHITIRTMQQHGVAIITINDNGNGIRENIRSRIFDPFFTTKEVGAGSGQGLYIAYDIVVNIHGGELLCESSPGEGTTFTIRLPLRQQEHS
jgi:PAS domain S-box-containing protein